MNEDDDSPLSLFEQAEVLQREATPQFDLLYSLRGFQYCDLVLAPAERAAWRLLSFNGKPQATASSDSTNTDASGLPLNEDEIATALAEADRRGTQTLAWATQSRGSLLDIALDHLTLARVAIYRAILEYANSHSEFPIPPSQLPNPHLAPALNGLRQAGQVNFVALALLTAALHHHVTGDPDAARRDLDEAQQIAERGPMPLYLADVHLHRARLFRDKSELAKARTLIEAHHYGRRREELADAEAAAEDW